MGIDPYRTLFGWGSSRLEVGVQDDGVDEVCWTVIALTQTS